MDSVHIEEGLPVEVGREVGDVVLEKLLPDLAGEFSVRYLGVPACSAQVSMPVADIQIAAAEIAAVPFCGLHEQFAEAWVDDVVAVDKCDVLAGGCLDAHVACRSGTAVDGGFEEPECNLAGIVLQNAVCKFDRRICAVVIDDDHFQVLKGLLHNAVEVFSYLGGCVVNRSYDRNHAHNSFKYSTIS